MKIMSYLSGMPTVVVMGDVMLDLYLSGRVSRISPEAPVPVLHHMAERAVAGGAANVALNIAQLGGQARLVGLIGQDEGGARLTDVLRPLGLDHDLIASHDIETVTKTRVLAENHHQFLRIDRERFMALDKALCDTVLARLDAALEGAGILVLSDYDKGLLSDDMLPRVIALANARGVSVMVDPKRPDFAIYKGAQIIKPNLNELSTATGYDCHDIANRDLALKQISAQTGADILLTMSEKGMIYYPAAGGETIHMATSAREVFDVSGAGDTVMALFASVRASGAPIETAMHVANIAAGLVVAKVGTAVLEVAELDEALTQFSRHRNTSRPTQTEDDSNGEIMDLATAAARSAEWKRSGLRVGFTNGCFDLLHPGHVRILQAARSFCDKLIVGMNTDASVQRLKGPTRPVQQQDARACVMAAMTGVDGVVLFDEETPLNLIKAIVPDVLVKGADYEIKDIVGADFVLANKGKVERVPLKEGHSTTSLIARSNLPTPGEATS